MVRSFRVVMDLYPRFFDRQVSEPGIDPPAGVVVRDAVFFDMHGLVCVSAKDTLGFMVIRERDGARRDLARHPQPARVEAVDEARDRLVFEIELLQLQIEGSTPAAKAQIVDLESVKLVAMNGDVPQASVLPGVMLVNTYPDQVRHDVGEAMIMIAFDPDDFNASLGIGELTDIAEELPVIFRETGEIEIGKDVAQQDQALEAGFFEQRGGFPRMARFRAEVQVGKDQRVVGMRIHDWILARDCYGVINVASILVHGGN